CGFNQLVNNVATTRYRWGAAVPLVVRLPVGGGLGAGPFHSQNVEAWFCHVPGLKVVAPATPADAKGLLLAALDDGNPVLVLEHKRLYRRTRGPVPAGHFSGTPALEWCERQLLARIHRYTISRLRKEIEPVAAHDFMRFLCDWQRVSKSNRGSGPEAL